jgi:hypothetical protein
VLIDLEMHLGDELSTRPDQATSGMFAASSFHTIAFGLATNWLLAGQTIVGFNILLKRICC